MRFFILLFKTWTHGALKELLDEKMNKYEHM